MPVYTGTIQLQGDPNELPAVISIDEGRINITSKGQPIGTWALRDAGFRHSEDAVVMSVEGEELRISVENTDSLGRAVGLRPASESRRSSFAQPHPSQQAEEPQRPKRSAEEMAREVAEEVDPYLAEVREGIARIDLSRNAWIGIGVGLLVAVLLPSVSVPVLSIAGAVAIVAGAAAMFEPSIEERIPEPVTPVQVLAAGAAAFVLVALILLIR